MQEVKSVTNGTFTGSSEGWTLGTGWEPHSPIKGNMAIEHKIITQPHTFIPTIKTPIRWLIWKLTGRIYVRITYSISGLSESKKWWQIWK